MGRRFFRIIVGILRYASLILCLLLLAAWGASMWHHVWLSHWDGSLRMVRWARVTCGRVDVAIETYSSAPEGWEDGFRWGYTRLSGTGTSVWHRMRPILPQIERLNVGRPGGAAYSYEEKVLLIPLWVILAPQLPLTAWLWWPWIRERRKKRSVGFEVETKPTEPAKET